MKLSEFSSLHFESRAKCAEALGVSYQHFNNLVARQTQVVELKDGKWMTVTKYNKVFEF